VIINYAICTRKIKSTVAMAKVAFNKKTLFTSKLDLNLRKKVEKFYISNICVWCYNFDIAESTSEISSKF